MLRALAEAALALTLAPTCAACDGVLEHPLDGAVCPACWRSVTPLTPPLCEACGDPLATWRPVTLATSLCPRCRRRPRLVTRARSIGAYDGVLRAIIHALKYDARRSLAAPLGALMRERGSTVLEGADALVPVPLHRSRQRERGFNQAADLAHAIGLPVASILTRILPTPHQTGLHAAERRRNLTGAFALPRRAAEWRGATLVLIDDVLTTGTTLEECARALREGGVKEIRALTAARVVTARR